MLHTLRNIFAQNFFVCSVLSVSVLSGPFYSTFCFVFSMADDIQPVTVGAGAAVATEAGVRIDNDEGGRLDLHSGVKIGR